MWLMARDTTAVCTHGGPTKANGNCTTPGPDNLPVQCVGEWAENDKHAYLRAYIAATREARRKFLLPGAHGAPGGAGYLDMFAGPGKVRLRENGLVCEGSPMLALGHTDAPFTKVVLCDLDTENVETLRVRTAPFGARVQIFHGDCNEIAQQLAEALPEHGLNLAFVDPFKLDPLRFATLKTLATQCKRLDLFINFPTQDVKRNLKIYMNANNSLVDRTLGTSKWRSLINSTSDVFRLIDLFTDQLEGLGYTGVRNRTIPVTQSTNAELYRLIFASKNPLADKIWSSITTHTARGQRGFGFE